MSPTNAPPSDRFYRKVTSKAARFVFTKLLSSGPAVEFHSFRLILGDVGRSVAAYAGAGIYLDVALGWVTDSIATCPVTLDAEGEVVREAPCPDFTAGDLDAAAATFGGLDATTKWQYTNYGADHLCFDPSGQRLLLAPWP